MRPNRPAPGGTNTRVAVFDYSRAIFSCLCCLGDNRRDWLEFPVKFLFESTLFRRSHVVKMFWLCGVRLLPGRIRPDLPAGLA
jgi:hypothetical protein